MSENLNLDRITNVENNKEEAKQNESFKSTHRSSDDVNLNSNVTEEDPSTSAPVEILSEFLSSFMSRDYRSALHYCRLILQYEPDNEIVQDFYPLLLEKINSNSCESDDSDASSFGTKSDSSTEYFSSAFSGAENNSASSGFSSDEEEFSAASSE